MATISGSIHTAYLIKAVMSHGTSTEIAEKSGWHEDTIRKYMKQWHRMGLVYVVAWRKNGRGVSAIWGLRTNGEQDALRPPKLTDKQRNRRWINGLIAKAVAEHDKDLKARLQ